MTHHQNGHHPNLAVYIPSPPLHCSDTDGQQTLTKQQQQQQYSTTTTAASSSSSLSSVSFQLLPFPHHSTPPNSHHHHHHQQDYQPGMTTPLSFSSSQKPNTHSVNTTTTTTHSPHHLPAAPPSPSGVLLPAHGDASLFSSRRTSLDLDVSPPDPFCLPVSSSPLSSTSSLGGSRNNSTTTVNGVINAQQNHIQQQHQQQQQQQQSATSLCSTLLRNKLESVLHFRHRHNSNHGSGNTLGSICNGNSNHKSHTQQQQQQQQQREDRKKPYGPIPSTRLHCTAQSAKSTTTLTEITKHSTTAQNHTTTTTTTKTKVVTKTLTSATHVIVTFARTHHALYMWLKTMARLFNYGSMQRTVANMFTWAHTECDVYNNTQSSDYDIPLLDVLHEDMSSFQYPCYDLTFDDDDSDNETNALCHLINRHACSKSNNDNDNDTVDIHVRLQRHVADWIDTLSHDGGASSLALKGTTVLERIAKHVCVHGLEERVFDVCMLPSTSAQLYYDLGLIIPYQSSSSPQRPEQQQLQSQMTWNGIKQETHNSGNPLVKVMHFQQQHHHHQPITTVVS